jgi:hypothetical protein
MKKLICLSLFIIVCTEFFYAQEIAVTSTGRKVVLNTNGTWYYQDEEIKQKFQIINVGANSQDSYQRHVFARIRNNTKNDYDLVSFAVDLFYKDKMVGTEEDVVFDFEAGTIKTISIYTNTVFDKYIISAQTTQLKY